MAEGQNSMACGKIIKGIAGFYYVAADDKEAVGKAASLSPVSPPVVFSQEELFECKAKGSFRNESIKPLVGDQVIFDVIDEQEKKGNIVEILPRRNSLIRPAVANVDQILIVFAMKSPAPKYSLLERFLVLMQNENIPVILCFHKTDLSERKEQERLRNIYGKAGVQLLFTALSDEISLSGLKEKLAGKVTAICGPSGVGKSSLINRIQNHTNMETGEVSRKIQRGKHTTRHAQLIPVDGDSYIIDTPGFTSLFVDDVKAEELAMYYPEFSGYEGGCAYAGCSHTHEPDCLVKEAVQNGKIPRERYESYCELYEEKRQKERRR